MRKRVVVADSDNELLQQAQALLGGMGFDVVISQDGHDALHKALTTSPDALLLNLSLPGFDRLDVCAILSANERTRDIPLAFLTEERAGQPFGHALLSLPKPVKPQQLISAVTMLVASRRRASVVAV